VTEYEVGDFVKVEFADDSSCQSEWLWVRVESCGEANRLVFGRLDSVPVLDHGKKLGLGSQFAVSFDNIRDHNKPWEFGAAPRKA
jgi:hypothetical protein